MAVNDNAIVSWRAAFRGLGMSVLLLVPRYRLHDLPPLVSRLYKKRARASVLMKLSRPSCQRAVAEKMETSITTPRHHNLNDRTRELRTLASEFAEYGATRPIHSHI